MLIAVGAAGCRVAVAEVQAGRSCGLSIRLDLDAGSASIRCDGRQAAELSLAGAGRPPEGVLITTGAGFAGDLFLGPVLLHCGFALRERFLFTDPGAPPCGWTVQSAGGRAEVRACGGAAHPCDQLALCLDQVRPGALSATAACEPLAGPATVAAKWWIPQGGEGAALEVLAADGSVLAAIAVASGDFVGRGTAVATLWPRWQPTVWYDLELDLDPAAGTAAARINGIARGGFAIAAGRAVAGLRLRTAGQGAATVWADHLSIRPLLPPPADYPAEPPTPWC
jgi:hypothetical protein